jgi:hypothetical protein
MEETALMDIARDVRLFPGARIRYDFRDERP